VALFESPDVLALDKPAGVSMATSAAFGRSEGEVVAGLLSACGKPPDASLRLVHRLDVGTSGVVLLARGEAAQRALSAAFQEGRVRKTYRALVWGQPDPAAGVYEDALGRDARDGRRMAVRRVGKRAITRYRTLAAFEALADLEVQPETGRTHQIRVHLSAHGHPIAGDDLYGAATRWQTVADPLARSAIAKLTRPLLHAARVEIPDMGLDVAAPLPDDYVRTLEVLRVTP
jgi:23S rRNA pseudouridine1911/1915/1917 synthase